MASRGKAVVARSAAVGALALAGLCAGSGVAGATPYKTDPRIIISSTSPNGGQTIAVAMTGFKPGEELEGILRYPIQYAFSVRTDAQGQVAMNFVVPNYLACGSKDIVAVGRESNLSASAAFTVVRNCR